MKLTIESKENEIHVSYNGSKNEIVSAIANLMCSDNQFSELIGEAIEKSVKQANETLEELIKPK